MRYEWLEYCSDIVAFGSIKAAADVHHISPQGLSKSVKTFENELGVTLFERGANSVSLTPAGAKLMPYIHEARETGKRLVDAARSEHDGTSRAPLLILCSTFVFFCGMIAQLQDCIRRLSMPATCVQIKTNRLFEALLAEPSGIYEGKALCGFPLLFSTTRDANDAQLRKLALHGYAYEPLLRYEDGALVSKYHPLAQRESVRKDELLAYPFISSSAEQLSSITAWVGTENVTTAIADMHTRLDMLADDLSFILTPPFIDAASDERFRFVPLEDGYSIDVPFVYDTAYIAPADVAPMLDCLAAHYRTLAAGGLCSVLRAS